MPTNTNSRYGSTVVAHRSSRRLAETYIGRFADCIGETTYWNGSQHVPVTITWEAVKAPEGGWDVVSTVTPR